MSELLLCLVAVFLVIWIMLLMSENHRLKREVADLKRAVREKLAMTTGGVEVHNGHRLTQSELNRIDRTTARRH